VKADELNCKEVPTVIVSVLVTVSSVLAKEGGVASELLDQTDGGK
jgi:hypothetical protein